jgi:hypothetical protein
MNLCSMVLSRAHQRRRRERTGRESRGGVIHHQFVAHAATSSDDEGFWRAFRMSGRRPSEMCQANSNGSRTRSLTHLIFQAGSHESRDLSCGFRLQAEGSRLASKRVEERRHHSAAPRTDYGFRAGDRAAAALALEDAAECYSMALRSLDCLARGPERNDTRVELHTRRGR